MNVIPGMNTSSARHAATEIDPQILSGNTTAIPSENTGSSQKELLAQRFGVLTKALDKLVKNESPVAIDVTSETVAETVDEWQGKQKKRLEDNSKLSKDVKAFGNPPPGDPVLRAMVMNELMKFHDFEYELDLSPGSQRPGDVGNSLRVELDRIIATLPVMPAEVSDMRSPSADDQMQIKSTGDFFKDLQDLIGLIGDEYLAIYEHLIARYSDMFDDFNKKIMAKMSEWIKAVDDGKKIEFDGHGFWTAVDDLINKYERPPACVLFPPPDDNGTIPNASQEDAIKWAKAMGVDVGLVVKNPDTGGYYVRMDTGPLRKMRDSMPPNTVTWDSAKFQAWQTGFNTQEASMKNYLQIATSKYSNANAYHDNFIKILSSQLSQFAEMLKAYLS